MKFRVHSTLRENKEWVDSTYPQDFQSSYFELRTYSTKTSTPLSIPRSRPEGVIIVFELT